jgi:RNA polymerase sigma-B factor
MRSSEICQDVLHPRYADTSDLLVRWRTDRDRRARDELFTRFLPLARRLARRYSPSGAGVEDVVQVAGLGLLNALERFDPGRGISFSTFAIPTILGASATSATTAGPPMYRGTHRNSP